MRSFWNRYQLQILAVMAVACFVILATGCGKETVSFNTLETARLQANENGAFNAQSFRAQDPRFSNWDIVKRGDSTQNETCPNGDGWVSIDLIAPNKSTIAKLKCSTVSIAIGCMTSEDFKSKAYASEDGRCAPLSRVPHPLPKLVN